MMMVWKMDMSLVYHVDDSKAKIASCLTCQDDRARKEKREEEVDDVRCSLSTIIIFIISIITYL